MKIYIIQVYGLKKKKKPEATYFVPIKFITLD